MPRVLWQFKEDACGAAAGPGRAGATAPDEGLGDGGSDAAAAAASERAGEWARR